jgi:two-component system, OmpR family, response regulator RegX3
MSSRILIVDDDHAILDVLDYLFSAEGFDVDTASHGEAGLAAALSRPYDLIVLDVVLPGLSGTEICRRLRTQGKTAPILMLTARDAEVERVLGLELGADDYVTKPFSSAELVSRVRAILRRRALHRSTPGAGVQVGGLRLDVSRHQLVVDGARVRLTPAEFKLLSILADAPGRVFSRRQLMEHISDGADRLDEHACEVHISNLRRKIERDPAHPRRIVTVRSLGYKLVAT